MNIAHQTILALTLLACATACDKTRAPAEFAGADSVYTNGRIYTVDADAKPKIIDKDDVESAMPSKVSQMPAGLIDTLNEEELKDLVAYLLSGGNRKDKVYK